jgi:hypothetical protein
VIVVTVAGLIGAFHIGLTTQAQVRAALGPPTKVVAALDEPSGRRIGTRLYYGRSAYSFRNGRLADFGTTAPDVRTERGSHPGLRAADAAKLERAKVVPGCSGPTIRLRAPRGSTFFLTVVKGRVVGIEYAGPNSTVSEHC